MEIDKRTINVNVRMNTLEYQCLEERRALHEKQLRMVFPGANLTLSDMIRSLVLAGRNKQVKHRKTLSYTSAA